MTVVAAMAVVTLGCVSSQPQLNRANELQPREVVLVGRIELVPPLFPHEQVLEAPLTGRFRDKVLSRFSDSSALVDLGKEFYIRQPMSKTLLVSGGAVVIKTTNHVHEEIKLPGGLRYTLNPDDRAVYVGTVRYHRDDYNTITKTEVVDDYARVNREFVARYGAGLKLRNVRPESVKEK